MSRLIYRKQFELDLELYRFMFTLVKVQSFSTDCPFFVLNREFRFGRRQSSCENVKTDLNSNPLYITRSLACYGIENRSIKIRPKTSSGKRMQELDDFDDDDLLPE